MQFHKYTHTHTLARTTKKKKKRETSFRGTMKCFSFESCNTVLKNGVLQDINRQCGGRAACCCTIEKKERKMSSKKKKKTGERAGMVYITYSTGTILDDGKSSRFCFILALRRQQSFEGVAKLTSPQSIYSAVRDRSLHPVIHKKLPPPLHPRKKKTWIESAGRGLGVSMGNENLKLEGVIRCRLQSFYQCVMIRYTVESDQRMMTIRSRTRSVNHDRFI